MADLKSRGMLAGCMAIIAAVVSGTGVRFLAWDFAVIGALASILFSLLCAVCLSKSLEREAEQPNAKD